jgi:hypothetical protein
MSPRFWTFLFVLNAMAALAAVGAGVISAAVIHCSVVALAYLHLRRLR